VCWKWCVSITVWFCAEENGCMNFVAMEVVYVDE